jgi:hypothetical protein
MKTWFWLLLISLMFMAGCAPGYSAKKPASPEETPAFQGTGTVFQNPETGAEREMRIWREESGR